MKLYTKKGDDGTTGLFGGGRVGKDDPRIEAIGAVDELNGLIGLAAYGCRFDELGQELRVAQNLLFDLGADLAAPQLESSAELAAPRIDASHIEHLEAVIDRLDGELPPLTQFILPGGGALACYLHHARAVCRRAERRCVALGRVERVGEHELTFLNRLGDLLFAMARGANRLEGVEDVVWKG